MKKHLLIAVMVLALLVPAIIFAASYANITSKWVDGDLVFYDGSGNAVLKLDAVNRAIEIPAGSFISQLAHKVATIAMSAANVTLSAAQYICNILVVTGSPSGMALIVPTPSVSTVAVLYTVRNEGDASVLIQTAAGTSVTIGTGKTAEVFCKSTGCYRKTADATH